MKIEPISGILNNSYSLKHSTRQNNNSNKIKSIELYNSSGKKIITYFSDPVIKIIT